MRGNHSLYGGEGRFLAANTEQQGNDLKLPRAENRLILTSFSIPIPASWAFYSVIEPPSHPISPQHRSQMV